MNCLFIPLAKLLKSGFNTGHGTVREPQSIHTAANLACIVLQSNQNEMFGGQAFPTFDYDLAPYVAKSFVNHLKECLNDYWYRFYAAGNRANVKASLLLSVLLILLIL